MRTLEEHELRRALAAAIFEEPRGADGAQALRGSGRMRRGASDMRPGMPAGGRPVRRRAFATWLKTIAAALACGFALSACGGGNGSPSPSGPAVLPVGPGAIRVIDADTVDIDGVRWRLFGIDAPESRQTCRAWGRTWDCGAAATEALMSRAAGMSCSGSGTDRYGWNIGVCSAGAEDLGAWLVANGWALAWRQHADDYADGEEEARSNGRGIHRGAFVAPWDWRRGARLGGEDTFSWIATAPLDAGALADRLLRGDERGFRGQLLDESVFGIAGGGIAVSFGALSSGSPAGIGGGVWRGSMTGVQRSSTEDAQGLAALSVVGDAVIRIEDFARPEADIAFGNFVWPDLDVDLAGRRTDAVAGIRWENVALERGAFRASGADGSIRGQFYGPGHEEAGGVFEHSGMVGAFGATRE